MVKSLISSAEDMGSVPGGGTNIPRTTGQLSPSTTTTEPTHSRALNGNKRSPSTATRTQFRQINKMKIKKKNKKAKTHNGHPSCLDSYTLITTETTGITPPSTVQDQAEARAYQVREVPSEQFPGTDTLTSYPCQGIGEAWLGNSLAPRRAWPPRPGMSQKLGLLHSQSGSSYW